MRGAIRIAEEPQFQRFNKKYPNGFGIFQFWSSQRRVSESFGMFQKVSTGMKLQCGRGSEELVVEHKGAGCTHRVFWVVAVCFERLRAGCIFRVLHPTWDAPLCPADFATDASRSVAGKPLVTSLRVKAPASRIFGNADRGGRRCGDGGAARNRSFDAGL
jgi:hypothetical protein